MKLNDDIIAYLGLSNTEKKEIGPKSPDVAECSYTICLHNAPAPMQTTQKATVLWWGLSD